MPTRTIIIQILELQDKLHPRLWPTYALDIFLKTVEKYKKARKKNKLKYIAQAFLDACIVLNRDYLMGAQAFEVFNNLATDYGANKDDIEKEINKLLEKLGRKPDESI